jgi:hypothetical protein
MATANWNGYTFDIYDPNTAWNDVAGVYIFAGIAQNGRWSAYYIGICDSFKNRHVNHERWDEAVRLGATHVHARVERLEATRQAIEKDLIQVCQPPLNTHHR